MRARTRNTLTVASAVYFVLTGFLVGRLPLPWFNLLLVVAALPLVWLLWAFCRWSSYQHARRWARDIEKVHGPQAAAMAGRVRR